MIERLDKQVGEFEYLYNHVIKLVQDNVVKSISPLTGYQKEFVKYLIMCKAKGFNPALIVQRTESKNYLMDTAIDIETHIENELNIEK